MLIREFRWLAGKKIAIDMERVTEIHPGDVENETEISCGTGFIHTVDEPYDSVLRQWKVAQANVDSFRDAITRRITG